MDKVLAELSERAEREKLMTGYVLTFENELNVRLFSIEYPSDGTSATVIFEIYAKRRDSSEYEQRIALICRSVPINGKS